MFISFFKHFGIALTFLLIISPQTLSKPFHNNGSPNFQVVGDQGQIPVITDVIQDKQGVIWFTTQEGFFRYDGAGFKRFLNQKDDPNSLVANYVYRLWEAQDGHIWIGSRAKGLSVLDPVTGQFSNQSPLIEGVDSSNQIFDIKGNKNGQILIATTAGIVWQDPSKNYKALFSDISGCQHPQSKPRFFLWQNPTTFWLIGTKQLCKVSVDVGKRELKGTHIKTFENGELATGMLDEDFIWLAGRSGGIHKLDTRDNSLISVSNAHEMSLDIDSLLTFELLKFDDKTIWAGTYLSGILVIDKDSAKVMRVIHHQEGNAFSIGGNNVSAFLRDHTGLLWVGTWGTGMFKYNPINDVGNMITKVLVPGNTFRSADIFRVMERSNGELWFALNDKGIDIYSSQTGKLSPLTSPAGLSDKKIMRMKELSNGDIWLAGLSELFYYQQATNSLKTFEFPSSDTIRSMLVDESDTIWLGMEDSLWRFSKERENFVQLKTVSNETEEFRYFVESMVIDKQNRLWIGASSGVYLLEQGSDELIALSKKHSELSGIIASIIKDSQDRIWVANFSTASLLTVQGKTTDLLITDVTKQLFSKQAYLKNGFKIDGVLLEDLKGRIWASGLVIEEDINEAHKLNMGDFIIWIGSQIINQEGVIIATGPNGVLTLNTNLWQPWKYEPKTIISGLSINGHKIHGSTASLALPPHTKSIRVDYAATDYLAPEKIQYAYQLSGYDEQWQLTDEHHITYTNLSPGSYVLNLKSTNSEGVWSAHVTSIPIQQLPAWYQTYWFYLLCIILLLMLMLIVLKLRTKSLEQQKIKLQSLVDERTQHLIELGSMGQEITSSLDLDKVLKIIHSRISTLLDSHVFMVGLVNTKDNTLDMVAWYEGDEQIENAFFELSELNRPGPWCIANRKEIIAHTQTELSEHLGNILEPVVGIKSESVIYLPLVINDNVVGCLSVQSPKKHAYPENTINMLRTISTYAAIAIENAKSHTFLINAQERLIESGKQASLSYLVSGVAHEINTPVGIALTTVSGLGSQAQDLKSKLENNQIRKSDIESFVAFSIEADKLMQSSLNRCSKLVQDFKKISADQFDSGKREVELRTYLEDILSTFSSVIAEHKISYHIEGDNPYLLLDPGIISQIMSNLIQNAITHAFDAEFEKQNNEIQKRISISVKACDRTVEIKFSDNGKGMDDETKSQIFIPFYTTKRGTERIGLGLNIVYNLTTSGLDGTLDVSSKKFEGSQFTLTFSWQKK